MSRNYTLTNQVAASLTKPSTKKFRPYIGMSGASGCRRTMWFGKKWFPVPEDDFLSQLRFRDGNEGEVNMIQMLVDAGFRISDLQAELVDPGIPEFKGHIDGVIWLEEKPVLLELKRMHHDGFESLLKSKSIKETHPGYYAQVVVYLWNLKQALYPEITQGVIWVQSKNRHQFYEEYISLDDDYVKEVRDKVRNVVHCLNTYGIPRRDYSPFGDKECRWCEFKKACIHIGPNAIKKVSKEFVDSFKYVSP